MHEPPYDTSSLARLDIGFQIKFLVGVLTHHWLTTKPINRGIQPCIFLAYE